VEGAAIASAGRQEWKHNLVVATSERAFVSAAFIEDADGDATEVEKETHDASAEHIMEVNKGVDIVLVNEFFDKLIKAFDAFVLIFYVNAFNDEIGRVVDKDVCH
jgi:hypothetical protein